MWCGDFKFRFGGTEYFVTEPHRKLDPKYEPLIRWARQHSAANIYFEENYVEITGVDITQFKDDLFSKEGKIFITTSEDLNVGFHGKLENAYYETSDIDTDVEWFRKLLYKIEVMDKDGIKPEYGSLPFSAFCKMLFDELSLGEAMVSALQEMSDTLNDPELKETIDQVTREATKRKEQSVENFEEEEESILSQEYELESLWKDSTLLPTLKINKTIFALLRTNMSAYQCGVCGAHTLRVVDGKLNCATCDTEFGDIDEFK